MHNFVDFEIRRRSAFLRILRYVMTMPVHIIESLNIIRRTFLDIVNTPIYWANKFTVESAAARRTTTKRKPYNFLIDIGPWKNKLDTCSSLSNHSLTLLCLGLGNQELHVATFAAAYLLLMLLPLFGGSGIVPDVSSPVAKSTSVLYFVVNSAVPLISLVTFLLMSNYIVHLMNKLCVVHDELKIIGIDEDLDELFKNISLTTVTANVVIGTICLLAVIFEPFWPVHISIAYTIRECICLNTLLIFAQILLCIGKRFTLLNKKFYEVFKTTDRTASADISRTVMAEKKSKKDDRESHIRKLEILHLELSELTERTTRIFGIPILLNTLSFLCELVVSSHWIYFIDLNPRFDHVSAGSVWYVVVNILCPILRMAIVAIELIIIAYAASTTCQPGNTTKIVLFKVWNKLTPSELMDEFIMFSLQLLHKPVTVAVFGFFHLDYSYVYKIFCAMVAYFIIMIQLDT